MQQVNRKQNHAAQFTQAEEVVQTPTANWVNAFLLGIAMKLGGATIAWNYGLKVGFWEYSMAVVVIGAGYVFLGLCMSEMVSIMSFSGGYYGYARCAMGPFFGYIVGCCGVMESSFSFCTSVLKVGQFVTIVFELSDQYEPLWWYLTFLVVILCHVIGAKWFWQWIGVLSVSCLLLVFMFLLGSMPELDFEKYAGHNSQFRSDPKMFFTVYRLAVLFFVGFDMLTMTSGEMTEPKTAIPRAMLTLIGTLFVLAIWLMVTVSSQPPGITTELYQLDTLFPLRYGYERIFGVTRRQALCICVIPSFVTVLGYMYVVARQVTSMAKSGLMPAFFKQTVGPEQTPVYSMIFVSIFGSLGLFYSWQVNPYTTMSRFTTLAGCVVYISMFVCYLIFNTRFSNLDRTFRNPLGVVSAVAGLFIFSVIFVAMLALDTEYYPVNLMFFSYVILMIGYYYAYAETHQVFSATEQKVFFKAYIVNMKRRKKQSPFSRLYNDAFRYLCCNSKKLMSKGKVFASEDGSSMVSGSRSEAHSVNSDSHQDHESTCNDKDSKQLRSSSETSSAHYQSKLKDSIQTVEIMDPKSNTTSRFNSFFTLIWGSSKETTYSELESSRSDSSGRIDKTISVSRHQPNMESIEEGAVCTLEVHQESLLDPKENDEEVDDLSNKPKIVDGNRDIHHEPDKNCASITEFNV
jgi:ethanolamine permease